MILVMYSHATKHSLLKVMALENAYISLFWNFKIMKWILLTIQSDVKVSELHKEPVSLNSHSHTSGMTVTINNSFLLFS